MKTRNNILMWEIVVTLRKKYNFLCWKLVKIWKSIWQFSLKNVWIVSGSFLKIYYSIFGLEFSCLIVFPFMYHIHTLSIWNMIKMSKYISATHPLVRVSSPRLRMRPLPLLRQRLERVLRAGQPGGQAQEQRGDLERKNASNCCFWVNICQNTLLHPKNI